MGLAQGLLFQSSWSVTNTPRPLTGRLQRAWIQAFDIKLELGRAATALMLPNGPFYQDTGGSWIYVVAPDGRHASRRTVRLGRRNPEHIEVVDGLSSGEKPRTE
jgi:HlyD family secretion protein